MVGDNWDLRLAYRSYCYAEAERQVQGDFPHIRLVDSHVARAYLAVIEPWNLATRHRIAKAFVDRFHSNAGQLAKAVGQDEADHINKFNELSTMLSQERWAKDAVGARAKRSMRKALSESIDRQIKESFGEGPQKEGGLLRLQYSLPPYVIDTDIDIGSTVGPLTYFHRVRSSKGMEMLSFISLFSSIGISSQTQWESWTLDNVDAMAYSLVALVEQFLTSFTVGPR